MIIILEGPDCVGKSTVAQELGRVLPLSNLLKLSGAPKDEPGEWYMRNVYNQLLPFFRATAQKQNIILDRFCTSERVYSALFKDYYPSYLDEYEIRLTSEFKIRQFVLLFGESKTIHQRIRQKSIDFPNEKHGDFDTIKRVNEYYQNMFNRPGRINESQFPTYLMYVEDFPNAESIVKHIIEMCEIPTVKDDTYSTLKERKGDF